MERLNAITSPAIYPRAAMLFRVAAVTDHLLTNLWLAEKFLGVRGTLNDHILSMTGVGFRREGLDA